MCAVVVAHAVCERWANGECTLAEDGDVSDYLTMTYFTHDSAAGMTPIVLGPARSDPRDLKPS